MFAETDAGGAGEGLTITRHGHITRLKWHRLRRSLRDPLFSAEAMADGFRLGASMELDLRVRRDGGFVVLHDARLGRETDGAGAVRDLTRAELAEVRFRDQARGVVFSEELAGLLAVAHPGALLQFDMKDDLATIGPAGIDHLAAHFAATAAPVIVSGDCLDLILAVGERLPALKRGIDPTDRLVALLHAEGPAAAEAALLTDLRGPTHPDMVYLAWPLLLAAAEARLDMVALSHAEGVPVDAWTYTPKGIGSGFSDVEWRRWRSLLALRPDQITTDEAVALERAHAARAVAADQPD